MEWSHLLQVLVGVWRMAEVNVREPCLAREGQEVLRVTLELYKYAYDEYLQYMMTIKGGVPDAQVIDFSISHSYHSVTSSTTHSTTHPSSTHTS